MFQKTKTHLKLAKANNEICWFTYWQIQGYMASCVVRCRDSTYSQGFHWFKSLLSTFSVRSFFRLMFQKWFHSSQHHILSPCQSEKEKVSSLVFNKSKEAFSSETPRKSLLAFYWSKVSYILTCKAILIPGKVWMGFADWSKLIRAHPWNRVESLPLGVKLFHKGNLGCYHHGRGGNGYRQQNPRYLPQCSESMTSTTAHSLPWIGPLHLTVITLDANVNIFCRITKE